MLKETKEYPDSWFWYASVFIILGIATVSFIYVLFLEIMR